MLYKNNCIALELDVNHAKLAFNAEKNGKRLNERKARSISLAKIFYSESEKIENENLAKMMKKRAGRIYACCSNREIAVNSDGYAYTLHTHRCKDRNCVECQRVRAFVLQEKIRAITPELIEKTSKTDGLIFGTLTIKNPLVTELKDYLKLMSRAFARLMTRKKLKGVMHGGFRCFEVTRGNIKGHCHPHIHFLLQVDKKYFNNKGLHYMRAEEWAEEWTKCLEAEAKKAGLPFNRSDYPNARAFVKILRVQTAESVKNKDKKQYATIEDLQKEGDHVINYVLKYTAKEDENSEKALVKNDKWFIEYDKQIKGIRAISFFGIYKDLIAELPEFEYVEKEIKEKIGSNKIFTAQWCDDHQYVLSNQTLEEALNKKRLNIVGTIKRTLNIQIENLAISYNLLINASMSKQDKTLKEQEKEAVIDGFYNHNSVENKLLNTEVKENYEEIESLVLNVNDLKDRILKTFEKLEKTGEVKKFENTYLDAYGFLFDSQMFEKINSFDLNITKLKRDINIIIQSQKELEFTKDSEIPF